MFFTKSDTISIMKTKARIPSAIKKRFTIKIGKNKKIRIKGKSAGLAHRLLHKTSQNKKRKGVRKLGESLSSFVEKRILNI